MSDAAKPIRVGLIGVSTERGWARDAHIPAIRATPGVELAAIANRSIDSARKAADAFGAPMAFGNVDEMLASDIDLAVVTVRVPEHQRLVNSVLDAGKMVYCEWPLGRTLAEALEMEAMAQRAGKKAIVGLQMRWAPAVRYMRDLIANDFVGRILSGTLIGSGALWGPEIDAEYEYAMVRENGATMLAIVCSHTVDGFCSLVGEFTSVQALEVQRRTETKIRETGAMVSMTSPDQVLFAGVVQGGAPVSVHYRGGIHSGTILAMEINGTKGSLRLTGASGGGQSAILTLEGASGDSKVMKPMPLPEPYSPDASLQPRAFALAGAYAQLVADVRNGTSRSASFSDAVRRHRLIEAIERSAATGMRETLV
jgi:predicted dehydrogenase